LDKRGGAHSLRRVSFGVMGEDSTEQPRGDRPQNSRLTSRRVTVQEASEILGVTVEAVRGRIKRGKLEAEREKDGSVYVWLATDLATTGNNQPPTSHGQPTASQQPGNRLDNQEQLVESLLDQVAYMRVQLAAEREANRENRRLLAAALERVPANEPPETTTTTTAQSLESAAETTEGVETPDRDEGAQEGGQRRSWWRRLFGA